MSVVAHRFYLMAIDATDLTTRPGGGRAAQAVLASARAHRWAAQQHEAALLADVVEWVVEHPAELGSEAAAAWRVERVGREPLVDALGADGVPAVTAGAVAELGVALSMSPQAVRGLVADALELAFRLPRLWSRVLAGEVPAWRARTIAEATAVVCREAADAVDRQIAPIAHRQSFSGLDRVVREALLRHDPATFWERDAAQRERRHVQVGIADTTLLGLTPVSAVLDLSDALDLDAALRHAAAQRAAWGSAETEDARRARGLGDLAREHLSWSGERPVSAGPVVIATGADSESGSWSDATVTSLAPARSGDDRGGHEGTGARVRPSRQVVLYLHLDEADVRDGHRNAASHPPTTFGRVENTRRLVSVDTIRDWCGAPDTHITVRSVVDLNAEYRSDGYAVPDRLREQVRLRDGTCVFPGCTASGLTCQPDHVVPFDPADPRAGGQTATGNLAMLCTRHHHLKTFAPGWRYALLPDGSYEWTTPSGTRVRRDREGTCHVVIPGDVVPDT